jgi:hypothetical protein
VRATPPLRRAPVYDESTPSAIPSAHRRRTPITLPPSICALTLGIGLLLLAATRVSAQSEIQSWADATLGKLIPRADYRFTHYSAEPVEGQGTDLQRSEHAFSLSAPLLQDSRNEWTVSAGVTLQDLDTRAILPDTGERFPDELWDVRLGSAYRHKFDNGWIGGLSLTVGSPSDRPFASWDEMLVRAITMVRVPQGERNAWLFSLIYATDQEVLGLRGVPVPGIAYVYVPSERFRAVIGVPFTSVEVRPLEKLILEAQYFPVRRVRARATYVLFRPLRLYVGFDWDNDHYFRADRPDKDDRLFYYEKRVTGGVRLDLRHVGFQVLGGYAFDRFYFEGEDYSDRHHNRLDIGSGPFVAAGVAVRF